MKELSSTAHYYASLIQNILISSSTTTQSQEKLSSPLLDPKQLPRSLFNVLEQSGNTEKDRTKSPLTHSLSLQLLHQNQSTRYDDDSDRTSKSFRPRDSEDKDDSDRSPYCSKKDYESLSQNSSPSRKRLRYHPILDDCDQEKSTYENCYQRSRKLNHKSRSSSMSGSYKQENIKTGGWRTEPGSSRLSICHNKSEHEFINNEKEERNNKDKVNNNDPRVGYTDQALLFNKKDQVIVDSLKQQLIITIHPNVEELKINEILLKHLRVGLIVRGIVVQYIRPLHSLEISITAIEDPGYVDDSDCDYYYDSALISSRYLCDMSSSPRTFELTATYHNSSKREGLRGLLRLSRKSEDIRELFCLRPNELQRLKGPDNSITMVPKPGIFIRSILRYPDRRILSDIGQSWGPNGKDNNEQQKLDRNEEEGNQLADDHKSEESNVYYGYQVLDKLQIDVLLEFSQKSFTKWKLPTGYITNCRGFEIHQRCLNPPASSDILNVTTTTPLANSFSNQDIVRFPVEATFISVESRSISSTIGLLDRIVSDLKFGNPKSRAVRVADIPPFSTIPSMFSVVRLSQIAMPYAKKLGIECNKGKSFCYSLYQLQEQYWAKALVRTGIQLARSGEYEAAIVQYDSALINMPNCVDALVARGAAKANLGQFDEAIKNFDSALRKDPRDENAKTYRRKTIEMKQRCEMERMGQTASSLYPQTSNISSCQSRKFLLNWQDEQKRLQKYQKY